MSGDEEMEEIIIVEDDDMDLFSVDLDYEFDANRFFDFTRPESDSEAEVSESWFQSAGTYPPSPFIVKFKWREELYLENAIASSKSNALDAGESVISNSSYSGCEIDPNVLDDNREGQKDHDEMVENTEKTKANYVGKSSFMKSPSFMKPTASHLAKIKPASEICSNRSMGRSPSSRTTFSEASSRSALSVYLQATKRQKLDIGYLRKVARLKHQNQLLHKLSKVPSVVANSISYRPKPTIPREPKLETANRAQRHRCRNNPETDVTTNLKPSLSKERPVNGKILKTSPSSPQKKNERQPHASQRPKNQNSEYISSEGITDVERLNDAIVPKQEKCGAAKRTEVRPFSKQKLKHSAENSSSCNPPTELFKKLSLKSEVERNAASRTKQQSNKKVPKENVEGSLRQEVSVS